MYSEKVMDHFQKLILSKTANLKHLDAVQQLQQAAWQQNL